MYISLKTLRALSTNIFVILTLLLSANAVAHGPAWEKLKILTDKIKADPNNPALYVKRAYVYEINEHWKDSLKDLKRAVKLDPKNPEYDLLIGNVKFHAGKNKQALEYINRYIQLFPKHTEALLIRAHTLQNLKQPQLAIKDFSAAINSTKQPLPEWYIEYADTLLHIGETQTKTKKAKQIKIKQALQVIDQGIQNLGDLTVLHIRGAEIDQLSGNTNRALDRMNIIIRKHQRKDHWLSRRGDILYQAGRHDEARAAYQAALNALTGLPQRLQSTPASKKLALKLNEHLTNK